MATANDLLTAAYRRARILGVDQVLGGAVAASALASLNRLLEVWSINKLLVYQVLQENFALVAGTASYTIGTGATFNTNWPIKLVDGCFVRRNGIDYPVKVLEDRVLYDRIIVKTTQGVPYALFYDRAYPQGTIYLHYVPDQADRLYINSWKRISSLAALVTQVSLPPGYEALIVDGMVIYLCAEAGRSAPRDVKKSFNDIVTALGQVNEESLVMSLDQSLFRKGNAYNITSDQ